MSKTYIKINNELKEWKNFHSPYPELVITHSSKTLLMPKSIPLDINDFDSLSMNSTIQKWDIERIYDDGSKQTGYIEGVVSENSFKPKKFIWINKDDLTKNDIYLDETYAH